MFEPLAFARSRCSDAYERKTFTANVVVIVPGQAGATV